VCACRYELAFDAPVPPAVLPGQRRRLDAAQLVVSAEGRTRVRALVAASLQLDGSRTRVRRVSERLVADPLAVTASIAHFELLNARSVALSADAAPPLLREPAAYWVCAQWLTPRWHVSHTAGAERLLCSSAPCGHAFGQTALRAMMRIELEEIRRRSASDESAVLDGGADGVSDEAFEAQFRAYILRIFLLGFAPPLVAFGLAKLLRAAAEVMAT
jgi:hypothetical protein